MEPALKELMESPPDIVLGIIVGRWAPGRVHPFYAQTPQLKEIVKEGQKAGMVVYVFVPSSIDWGNRCIRGYTIRQKNGKSSWVSGIFPFPGVVYNRILHRSLEHAPFVAQTKKRLENEKIKIFNPGFFDKWQIQKALWDDIQVRTYLPWTERLQECQKIPVLLQRFPLLYLKPVGGSLGLGVIQVERSTGRSFICRFRENKTNISETFSSATELAAFLKRYRGNRRYIVQQGIRLKKSGGNPVDFRVHLNKGREGCWEVVGIGAKVAGDGSVTTHVYHGGRVEPAMQVFQAWYGHRAAKAMEKLKQVAVWAAEAVDRKMDGYIGELGLDIGVSESDEIWIFELNAKPGRTIFKHKELKPDGRRSARKIIEYAAYLVRGSGQEGS